jgi:hypothetical protein
MRPAVMARTDSYANGSADGAQTQAILMSIFHILKQRGHNLVSTVIETVRAYKISQAGRRRSFSASDGSRAPASNLATWAWLDFNFLATRFWVKRGRCQRAGGAAGVNAELDSCEPTAQGRHRSH